MNVRAQGESTFDRILAVLSVPLSIVFAISVLATTDAAFLPAREFARSFGGALTALGALHRDAWQYLGVSALWLSLLTFVPALVLTDRRTTIVAFLLVLGVAVGVAYSGQQRLLLDPIFLGFLPGAIAWAAAGLYFAFAFSVTHLGPVTTRFGRFARLSTIALSTIVGIAGLALNQLYLPRLYPSFHLALAFGLVAVLTHASSGFVTRAVDRGSYTAARAWSLVIALLAVFGLAFFALGKSPRADLITGLVRRYSVLGRAASLYADLARTRRGSVERDPQAVSRFAERSALPKLPADFDLSRYNVLFVSSEATRFDQTSLADEAFGTTPNLRAFEQRGAFSYARAYSTSSSTFQVMSAIMTMQYPSMVDMNLARYSWFGTLGNEDQTVAELFRNAGYATLRVTHNHTHSFDRNMIGLGRGFQVARLIDSPEQAPQTDRRICAEALRRIRAVPKKQRFFGWVFFVSPHGPYLVHDSQAPSATALDRYRQELKYMDSQFGELLKGLEVDGRLNDTIIIFSGDHGEEFREHGGTLHKQTVYSESIRVPLLIWLPGMKGKRIDQPTSLLYVFPWLLQHGSHEMRAVVHRTLELKIGPMLRATEGAVIAELLGHDRMESALIYDHIKINYDFLTDATELFDVSKDPLEQNNVLADSPERDKALRMLQRYREVRAATQRFTYARPNDPTEPGNRTAFADHANNNVTDANGTAPNNKIWFRRAIEKPPIVAPKPAYIPPPKAVMPPSR